MKKIEKITDAKFNALSENEKSNITGGFTHLNFETRNLEPKANTLEPFTVTPSGGHADPFETEDERILADSL